MIYPYLPVHTYLHSPMFTYLSIYLSISLSLYKYIYIYILYIYTYLPIGYFPWQPVWPNIELPGDEGQRAPFLEQLHRARHAGDLQLQLLRNPRSQVARDLGGTTQQLLLGR